MTVEQVIEEIKSMKPEEKVQVLECLKKERTMLPAQMMDDSDFTASADRVMNRHSSLLEKLAQ